MNNITENVKLGINKSGKFVWNNLLASIIIVFICLYGLDGEIIKFKLSILLGFYIWLFIKKGLFVSCLFTFLIILLGIYIWF